MTSLLRVGTVEARLVPFRWIWAEENAAAIAAHWERRRAVQPALFDGRVLAVADTALDGDTLRVRLFETDYAQLLAHIDLGFPDPLVRNGFAMGALRTRDGAFILGEMAPHTANAGRLYFPAGTPDLSDVGEGGTVDLAGSILREITEETGLDPALCSLEPGWTVVEESGRLAFMRGVALSLEAEEAVALIRRHLASQPSPELSAIRLLRRPEEIEAARMPAFLPVLLEDAFGRSQRYP